MKRKNLILVIAGYICICALICFIVSRPEKQKNESESTKTVYLYGENHAVKYILDYEIELWQKFYNEENMRHLFIENSYSAAQLLNEWMKADDDSILLQLYEDWEGTLIHNQDVIEFFKTIKKTCPETIFHGTDIGHQYNSNGTYYLKQLEEKGLKGSEQYTLTEEGNEQGKAYYNSNSNESLREQYMTKNFIRELDSLPENEKIMGIYGSDHINYYSKYAENNTIMYEQLQKHYKKENINFIVEDLTKIPPSDKYFKSIPTSEININNKTYTGSYFGEQDISFFLKDYKCRKYYRIENSYEDFKDCNKTGEVLPQSNYPVKINKGDVFMIEYYLKDGSSYKTYLRCDGNTFENEITTEVFVF